MTKKATAFEEKQQRKQFIDDTWDDGDKHGEVAAAGEDREEAASFGAKPVHEGMSGDFDAIKEPVGPVAAWYAVYVIVGWLTAGAAAALLGRRRHEERRIA